MELFAVTDTTLIIRLTIAALLGLLIGAERSRVGKRAGMRTYALVSLGAALFIIISGVVSLLAADSFSFDPLRVASQVVVGIGFLGAGVILWVAAGIGAACGFGLYMIATYVTFLTLFLFEAMWYIEEHFIKTAQTDVEKEFVLSAKKHINHDEGEG